ncbi:MAG: DUF6760 family protein [Halobacteriota archaeon]
MCYYFHWSGEEVLNLPHWERRSWCEQISRLNTKLSEDVER